MSAAEPTPQRFANPALRYLAATRPAFLSVTLVACLIGLASAHADGVTLNTTLAIVTVLFALVAHAGGNVINDYHDAVSGADDANTERLFPFTGGSRFIQNGVLSPRDTARFGYGLMALVVPAGVWLTVSAGPALLLIGVAGLLLGWAYSAPPLKLVSRGWGEAVVAACWLLVVVGADYVQRGDLAWTPFAAGLSFALLVANLLYINQFPDHAGDAAAGNIGRSAAGPTVAARAICARVARRPSPSSTRTSSGSVPPRPAWRTRARPTRSARSSRRRSRTPSTGLFSPPAARS